MNRQTLLQMWDLMRQRHGITLRLVAALPADALDRHPIPNMRTPKELLVHMYDVVVRAMAEGVARGEVVDRESLEQQLAAGIASRDDLLTFMRDNWSAADRAVAGIGDAQLAAEVKTPWGKNFPGGMIFGIIHDEYLHHRGQLYAYARALGVEPPMVWDVAHNDPEFRPRAEAHA